MKEEKKTHTLKTWPEFFEHLLFERKTFEVRKNDRGFEPGDDLVLREFSPCRKCNGSGGIPTYGGGPQPCHKCNGTGGKYTGRALERRVTYVMHGPRMGIENGYCVMGIHAL